MKVEMGESLGYSYLRHVKNCWLTQTNWKASEHWPKHLDDQELERIFSDIKRDSTRMAACSRKPRTRRSS